MAIFRPGALIGAISGRVGGAAFVVSSRGTIVRQPRYRTKRTTPILQITQTIFTANTRLWSTMLPATRSAWNTAAAAFFVTNRLGLHIHLSGFQLFIKYQSDSIVPTDVTNYLPPNMTAQPGLTLIVAAVTAGGPFNVQAAPIATTAYNRIDVWGARPFTSRPRVFLRYRRLNFSYSPITVLTDIWAQFIADMGTPIAGETVGVRLFPSRQGIIGGPPVDAILTVTP